MSANNSNKNKSSADNQATTKSWRSQGTSRQRRLDKFRSGKNQETEEIRQAEAIVPTTRPAPAGPRRKRNANVDANEAQKRAAKEKLIPTATAISSWFTPDAIFAPARPVPKITAIPVLTGLDSLSPVFFERQAIGKSNDHRFSLILYQCVTYSFYHEISSEYYANNRKFKTANYSAGITELYTTNILTSKLKALNACEIGCFVMYNEEVDPQELQNWIRHKTTVYKIHLGRYMTCLCDPKLLLFLVMNFEKVFEEKDAAITKQIVTYIRSELGYEFDNSNTDELELEDVRHAIVVLLPTVKDKVLLNHLSLVLNVRSLSELTTRTITQDDMQSVNSLMADYVSDAFSRHSVDSLICPKDDTTFGREVTSLGHTSSGFKLLEVSPLVSRTMYQAEYVMYTPGPQHLHYDQFVACNSIASLSFLFTSKQRPDLYTEWLGIPARPGAHVITTTREICMSTLRKAVINSD